MQKYEPVLFSPCQFAFKNVHNPGNSKAMRNLLTMFFLMTIPVLLFYYATQPYAIVTLQPSTFI